MLLVGNCCCFASNGIGFANFAKVLWFVYVCANVCECVWICECYAYKEQGNMCECVVTKWVRKKKANHVWHFFDFVVILVFVF